MSSSPVPSVASPTTTIMPETPTIEEKAGDNEVLKADVHLHPLSQLSATRKNVLVLIFCVANFVDVAQISGVGMGVVQISKDIKLPLNQMVWILTAYSLTFASTLLFAGRLSDLFPAELVFLGGFIGLGILSLVNSFVTSNKYGFLVIRALGGICGAMTVPSAYHLLVQMYPDPKEKEKKVALLGISGALGNALGVIISGLTMLASYHWFFRLLAIICLSFSAAIPFLLPMSRKALSASVTHKSTIPRWKRLDIVGVGIMLAFLVCFNLSLTLGPIDGWSSASFIAPFILSMLLAPSFFLWESWISPNIAVLPASIWKIKNVILASVGLLAPFSFFVTSQLLFTMYFQGVRRWSAIHSAAAVLPQGIAAVVAGALTQFTPWIIRNPRIVVPAGAVLAIVAEILMYFSDGGWGNDYWRFLFPAFVIGSVGAIFMFMAIGVNLIVYCPPEMSGVAGAWNQVVAQTGGTIALAVQAGLEGDDLSKWRTVARGFWFELAAFAAVAIAYAVFYKTPGAPEEEHELARERIQQVLDNLEQKKIGKNEAV